MRSKIMMGLLVPLALAGLLAGCGDDKKAKDFSSPPTADRASTCVSAEAPSTPPSEAPKRIVSLSATATETLFAIGAGDHVVAVDEQSNYPADAPKTDLSGYTPNVEAITNYTPDLVIAQDDLGGLVAGLSAVDIPVILQPSARDLGEAFVQIEKLGSVTGNEDAAAALVQSMCTEIDEILSDPPVASEPPTYYHELDNTLYTATEKTFIGQLYALLGLRNIAPDDPSGYVQLSPEAILQADPDLIFLADTKCCGQNAETLADRPGWATITAVRDEHVVELDDDIASRWGPRIVDLLRTIADAVRALEPAGAGSSD